MPLCDSHLYDKMVKTEEKDIKEGRYVDILVVREEIKFEG